MEAAASAPTTGVAFIYTSSPIQSISNQEGMEKGSTLRKKEESNLIPEGTDRVATDWPAAEPSSSKHLYTRQVKAAGP